MKNQHTPGPWAVSPYNNVTSRNGTIAKTEQMPGNDDSEREANAHLIAAAPELLAALEAMEAVLDGPIGDILNGEDMAKTGAYDAIERTRAAIAKAKGEA